MVNVSTAGAIRRTQEHLDEGTEGTLEYPATSDLVGDAHGAHWVIAHRRCGREGDCEQSAHVDLFKIASAILRIALVGGVGREKCSTDGLSLDLRPGGSVRLVDEHLENGLLAIGASVEVGAERDPVDIPEIIGGMTVLRLEGAVRPPSVAPVTSGMVGVELDFWGTVAVGGLGVLVGFGAVVGLDVSVGLGCSSA